MCLGIPGKVVDTFEEHGILMGKVSFDGVLKKVCLDHVREAGPGDYVLVHVGFALSKIDEAQAKETFDLLETMGGLEEIREPKT